MKSFSVRMLFLQYALVILFCGIQSTVWPVVFGHIQSPQLWLPWLIFLALYRPFFETLFMAYFYGLSMLAFTSLSLHIIWPAFLVLVSAASFAKNKIFWPGLRYFVLATAIAAVLWNGTVLILSGLLESPAAPLVLVQRIMELLLTVIACPAVYFCMSWLEKVRPDEYSQPSGPNNVESVS